MASLRRVIREIVGPRKDPTAVHDIDGDLVDLGLPLLELLEKYFRPEVTGLDNLPDGPALLVGNHNGGVTFLEPVFFGKALWAKSRERFDVHALAHDVLLDLPGIGNLLMMLGATRASHEASEAVLARGQKVLVFPGGNYEAFRPWTQRHRVDFGGHMGFVRLALRTGAPIVPILSLGSHEGFFVITRGQRLARALGVTRWLKSRSFPIFIGLPWGVGVGPLFHVPLPIKMAVEVGLPIPVDGYSPDDEHNPRVVQELYERVQHVLQTMMDRKVKERRRHGR